MIERFCFVTYITDLDRMMTMMMVFHTYMHTQTFTRLKWPVLANNLKLGI
jgi:hypothetical protein